MVIAHFRLLSLSPSLKTDSMAAFPSFSCSLRTNRVVRSDWFKPKKYLDFCKSKLFLAKYLKNVLKIANHCEYF